VAAGQVVGVDELAELVAAPGDASSTLAVPTTLSEVV